MRVRLAAENREQIPEMEGLVKAIENFEIKTDLFLAACMISMKGGSSLTKSVNYNECTTGRA